MKKTFQDPNVKVFTQEILPGNEIERNPRREGVRRVCAIHAPTVEDESKDI